MGFNWNELKTKVFCLFLEVLFQTFFVVCFLVRKYCLIKGFLILDQVIDNTGQFMCGGGYRFWGAVTGAQSSEVTTKIRLAVP